MIQNPLPHDHGQTIEQELEHMPSVENFQTVADIFKQLGDGSRIRIFWLLCHCEECVINLSAMVNMSSPAVSHHLKQLKSAGLIVSRRDGKEVYYKAADTEQARNFHHMIEWLASRKTKRNAMKKEESKVIAQKFQKIPNGTLALKLCRAGGTGTTLFGEQFRAVTAGKGVMEAYETFPGIEVSFNVFLASEIKFQHDASDSVLEIYYCRSGRVGWNMQDGTAV